MLFLQRVGWVLLSSLMLYIAWPPSSLGPLLFVGFIPLLFFFDTLLGLSLIKKYFFAFFGLLISMVLFSFIASFNAWGDFNLSVLVGVALNFLPVCIAVALFILFKNKKRAYMFFVFSWAAMELFILKWPFSAPFFLLSNGLSIHPSIIQHYSVWGGIGGTMYILAVNIVLFQILKKTLKENKIKKELILLLILIVPTVVSFISYNNEVEVNRKMQVGLVLPNFNQYSQKYKGEQKLLINEYNSLFSEGENTEYDIVLLPETAIINSGWIENLNKKTVVNPLDSLLAGQEIIFGSYMFSIYKPVNGVIPYNVKYDENSNLHYQTHNCVIHRSKDNYYTIRTKKKRVPFHEFMPLPSLLMFTEKWINQIGEQVYIVEHPRIQNRIMKSDSGVKMYALLCYESLYSDVLLELEEYETIYILTNEIWNDKILGKKQYFYNLTPKAIESGRSIIKVSNGGYSGYINSKGTIINFIDYNNRGVENIVVEISENRSLYSFIYGGIHLIIYSVSFALFLSLVLLKKQRG